MRDIALRDIVVLAICALLIVGGAYFWVTRESSNQERVALEPIQAVPMRVPNASESAPQPPAPIRTPDPIEPRAATPPAPADSATSRSTVASSTTSSDNTSSDASTSDSDATAPEPSERPSDATTPSDAMLPSSSSGAASDSSAVTAIVAAVTPPALPVRNSAQGWSVQAGAFKNADNATTLRDRLLKLGLAARVEIGADGVNRVLIGAYANAEAAKTASATVAAALK